MSTVICVRIPKKLKERMQKFRNVNWSELIRRFIENTVIQLEAEELLRKIEEDLKDIPELPVGTISRWIRIERETDLLPALKGEACRSFLSLILLL